MAQGSSGLGPAGAPGAAQRSDLDVSHANSQVVELVASYMHDRTNRDFDTLMTHFSRDESVFLDVAFNSQHVGFDQIRAAFVEFLGGSAPGARAYATRVLGDENSAVVFYTDEVGVLGRELNLVSAVNFHKGLIVREVDYSDGRHLSVTELDELFALKPGAPIEEFRYALGGQVATAGIRTVAEALGRAFTDADAKGAAALFASNAVFEDLTLHAEVIGAISIEVFLGKALEHLPYGAGAGLEHVLGNDQGGGYEWSADGKVARGLIAIELDDHARISKLSAIWNGSALTKPQLTTLSAFTIE